MQTRLKAQKFIKETDKRFNKSKPKKKKRKALSKIQRDDHTCRKRAFAGDRS